MKKVTYQLEEIKKAASFFIENINNNRVFALRGNMGVGKTTLTAAICQQLKVRETVNSPTFAIVNEYTTETEQTIYHFDCYRIKNCEEFVNAGLEELFYSGALCLIEWAENIEEILPLDLVNIFLTEDEEGKRTMEIE